MKRLLLIALLALNVAPGVPAQTVGVPKAEARGKGDPSGDLTGNAADVTTADAKKGITITDLANQAGQNKIAINFVWTLWRASW